MPDLLRMVAFPDGPGGGNPAGVVLEAGGLEEREMLAVAAAAGYAETAFVVDGPRGDPAVASLRYFSPVAEVPFCGHATVATAVALAARSGPGPMRFLTPAGPFEVVTRAGREGLVASFTSGEPVVGPVAAPVLARLLAVLGLEGAALAPDHPPRLSSTGNTHPVLVLRDAAAFDGFTFDPVVLRRLMLEQGWLGTVTVLHRIGGREYEARNPFPVGTMDEDPATGSAAAATGAYLRAVGAVGTPARVVIRQGRHVGRPSLLLVDVPPAGGITVTGGAAVLPEDG